MKFYCIKILVFFCWALYNILKSDNGQIFLEVAKKYYKYEIIDYDNDTKIDECIFVILVGGNMMHATRHFSQRQSQRGISKEVVEIVMAFGEIKGDKLFLNKKLCQKHIQLLEKDLSRT